MAGNDLVGKLSLAQKRYNDISHSLSFLYGKVYAGAGISEGFLKILLCFFRAILVFIEAAVGPVGVAIAGAGRTVSSGTAKGAVLGAVPGAV